MKNIRDSKLLSLAPGMLILWSCLQFGQFIDPAHLDVTPPVLTEVEVLSARSIDLVFNETVMLSGELSVPGHLSPLASSAEETRVHLTLGAEAHPGEEFFLSGFVRDERGNESGFTIPVYGYNPRIPLMLVNECTTQGSASHPDFVEIFILSDGNLGGACFYEGIPGDYSHRFLFPFCEVRNGEHLVLHCKPQGIPAEINETGDTAASGGIDAFPCARDFWLSGGKGLSGNNGVLSLYDRPGGTCIDALVYSNRTSVSDTAYRGFGSARMMRWADAVSLEGEWITENGEIRPEDAVCPEDSTATRSLSRSGTSDDTNSSSDWHITPSGGYTPGAANSDEVYR